MVVTIRVQFINFLFAMGVHFSLCFPKQQNNSRYDYLSTYNLRIRTEIVCYVLLYNC